MCGSDRLLTLWGKLSWGANPLAASTPGDGIPDGARVNPVGGTDLQVTVTSWSAANSSSNFRAGNGVSAYVNAESSGVPDYGNFTNQTNVGSDGGSHSATFDGAFVVTFPVDPTEQDAQLNLSLVQDTGTDGGTNGQTPLRTPVYSVDLEDPSTSPTLTVWSNVTGASYMLAFHHQVLPVQAKAPTWIYIPSDDSTLSSLPNGLQRYTGEQNFVELVINDTAGPSYSPYVAGIPYSDNLSDGTYAFGLAPELNYILVPRSVFLSSPLGESILNLSSNVTGGGGGNPGDPSDSAPDIPIDPTAANAVFQDQWAEESNGGYWFDCLTDASDCSASVGSIELAASTSSVSTTNTSLEGGVPADPSLEQNYSTLAIQAIYAFNESDPNEVEGLLAGLLLNTTGNFTGWLLNATGELDTLGLLPSVMAGLANATYTNDGGYGPPTSSATAPKAPLPWYRAAAAWVWGSVSGVATEVISIVWNAAVAAATFVADLAAAGPRYALRAVSQTAAALEEVGAVVASALDSILSWVEQQVLDRITAVFGPIADAIKSWASTQISPLSGAANESLAAYSGTGGNGARRAAIGGLSGVIATPAWGVGILGATLDVVLALLSPFCIVAGVVVGLILPAILKLLGALLSGGATASFLALAVTSASELTSTSASAVDSGVENLFNLTEGLTSSAAADVVDPTVSGDFWAFVGTMLGGIAATAYIFSVGTFPDDAAYTGLIASLLAAFLLALEYLISLAPGAASAGSPLIVGELMLAFAAAVIGLVGIAGGLVGSTEAPLAGGIAAVTGGLALWAGFEDVNHLSDEL